MMYVSYREWLEWCEAWALTWSTIGRAEFALRLMIRPGCWIMSPKDKVEAWQHAWAIISLAELAHRVSYNEGFRAGTRTWPSRYADGVQAGVNQTASAMLLGMRLLQGERTVSEIRDPPPAPVDAWECVLCGMDFAVDQGVARSILAHALDDRHDQEMRRAVCEALCSESHPRSVYPDRPT